MKQNKYVIVITGGIASGKSTVGEILINKGYKVIESDKIVHNLYDEGSKVYHEIIDEFGRKILSNNKVDRDKLGSIVYNNKDKIKKLNKIVHKFVVEELKKFSEKIDDNIIFLDIPLMIEEKDNLDEYNLKYDEIWLVKSDDNIRLKRLIERDNRSIEECNKIIDNQMKNNEKEKYADRIIKNDQGLEELESEINNALENFKIENGLK